MILITHSRGSIAVIHNFMQTIIANAAFLPPRSTSISTSKLRTTPIVDNARIRVQYSDNSGLFANGSDSEKRKLVAPDWTFEVFFLGQGLVSH